MITYIAINEEKRIYGVYKKPQSYTLTIEISQSLYDDLVQNSILYKYINNNLVKDTSILDAQKLNDNILNFRAYRAEKLVKYDILRINILSGDLDPITLQVYSPLTNEEKIWRVNVLNFTESITQYTTENDYPTLPQRLK